MSPTQAGVAFRMKVVPDSGERSDWAFKRWLRNYSRNRSVLVPYLCPARDQIRPHRMDDNGKAVSFQSTCRGLFHVPQWLRPCTRNTWGKTGKRTAGREKRIAYTTAERRSGRAASGKQASCFAAKVFERSGQRRPPRIKNEYPVGRRGREIRPDGFTHAPLDSVPVHCFADSAGNGKPKSGAPPPPLRASKTQRSDGWSCGSLTDRLSGTRTTAEPGWNEEVTADLQERGN